MKVEGVCTNNGCPTVVKNAYGANRHFRHVQLAEEDGALCVRCQHPLHVLAKVPNGHKFALGLIVCTESAMRVLGSDKQVRELIIKHVHGEWGDIDAHDWSANLRALKYDSPPDRQRIVSAYPIQDERVLIITEAGRHETTVLLLNEY